MVGMRVIVPFGKKKIQTGIVRSLSHSSQHAGKVKTLLDTLDEHPVVAEQHLAFWDWMADYYLSSPGEVMKAGLPAGLRLSSESRIQLNPAIDPQDYDLTDAQRRLVAALKEKGELTYADVAELLGVQNPYAPIKKLNEVGLILLFEIVKDKYRPKTIRQTQLAPTLAQQQDRLEQILNQATDKQQALLLRFLQLVPILQNPATNRKGIAKAQLLEQQSVGAYQTLLKKGIFQEFDQTISRIDQMLIHRPKEALEQFALSQGQQRALEEIQQFFASRKPVLLHGVTGSGKTQVYISLIREALERGEQALLLLPEIALTTQIVARLKQQFGNQFGIYHSRYSDNERVEVWKSVRRGDIRFVVGVRSGLFLPFERLGLIIIDEEHDNSYKQHEPAPRYHARDAAIYLATTHQIPILMGSATPSVEVYAQVMEAKYGLVTLSSRHGGAAMPITTFVNTRQATKQKTMHQGFSQQLLDALGNTLEQGKQAIIFQNRRGYAPRLVCEDCNWMPFCPNCDVTLTYHLSHLELRCHYCGHRERPTPACTSCGSQRVKTVGTGTERIEDDLRLLMPKARIARMDLDTTRRKTSYQQLISQFGNREIDILIGTQMVTKGFDFGHVQLVAVFDADAMLYFPDFRAHERSYQLISQVGGRAGRQKGDQPGQVIIQTANPDHPILRLVERQDYDAFFERELFERRKFNYPPNTRMVKLTVRSPERTICDQAAAALAKQMQQSVGFHRVLGPEYPPVDRIRNQYHKELFIKLERRGINLAQAKKRILQGIQTLQTLQTQSRYQILINVDPY